MKGVCGCDYFLLANIFWFLCQPVYIALAATVDSSFADEHLALYWSGYFVSAWMLFFAAWSE